MRKWIVLTLCCLVAAWVEACPPPTGHAIVDAQMVWNPIEYERVSGPSFSGTGCQVAIGYEIPNRWYSVSAIGQWRYKNMWSAGLLQKVDMLPQWIESPLIPQFILNTGYDCRNAIYIRPGIELNCGGHASYLNFVIRYEIGGIFSFNSSPTLDHQLSVGVQVWIGKPW